MPKKRSKEVGRRLVGLTLFKGSRSPVMCFATYEIRYNDGSVRFERGDSVHTTALPEDATKHCRPDLHTVLEAMFPLYQALREACLHADDVKES